MEIPIVGGAASALPSAPWRSEAGVEDGDASDRMGRDAVRACSLWATPPVKAAWCCQDVCGFRYAGDMLRLGASRAWGRTLGREETGGGAARAKRLARTCNVGAATAVFQAGPPRAK